MLLAVSYQWRPSARKNMFAVGKQIDIVPEMETEVGSYDVVRAQFRYLHRFAIVAISGACNLRDLAIFAPI
jgi:hypothetical protein